MKKTLTLTAFIICIISLIFIFGYLGIPKRTVVIKIPYGTNAYQTISILRAEGLILSRTLCMAYLRISGNINNIKAGTYTFSTRSLTPSIIQKLSRGSSALTKLTIPEGLTIQQTAELLASQGFGSKEEFLTMFTEQNLEGYLLPETYIISMDLSPRQIVDIIRKQFNKTFSSAWEIQTKKIGFTKQEVITLASIVEKEAKVDFERPIISAVFHNRLKSNKYLESCATIQYALGKWKKRLLHKDLKIESPYNTYQHIGLPPGPICSPGKKSIEAALYPAETDSLFFVSRGDGTHRFYTRYRDHLNGKKEYKQMLKEYNKRKKSKSFE